MDLIEGRQPVREALRAGRTIRRILIAEGAPAKGTLKDILDAAHAARVRVDRVPRSALDQRATSRAHQGVIAEAEPAPERSWREGVEIARKRAESPILLALDGIQDPQNLGAILRSAEVFGVHAVLLPKRRSAQLTPVVLKAAAGASEHLVIDVVTNLERTLAACRDEGLWVVALDGAAEQTVEACDLLGEPVVVVVGAEGAGVSRLIRDRADAVIRIPTKGNVESLNASVAAGICLWEAARRRK